MPPAHCCGRGRRRRRGSSRNSGVGVTVALGPRVARRVRGPHGARGFATAFTTRYSSLSALVAAFVTPLFLWWFGHPALASLFVVLTLLLFWKHSENIKRLQAGTEGRIGAK